MEVREHQKENRDFFNRLVSFYEFGFVEFVNRRLQKRVLRNVSLKDSVVLDAGCGTGTFLELVKLEDKKSKIYGIDVSENMIKASEKRLRDAHLLVESSEDISFKDKFDFIFSIDSFHHYADQEKSIKNFYEALKKGGKLVVADFSLGRFGNWLFKKFEPGNSKMLLKKEFLVIFSKFGFKEVKQKRLGLFSVLTIGSKI